MNKSYPTIRLQLILASLLGLAALFPAFAAAEPRSPQLAATLRAGQPFTQARAALLRQGWKPVPMHIGDNYEYSGQDLELLDLKYVELDSCTLRSLCIFYYRKAGTCLRVDTIGEQVPRMKVRLWSRECAPVLPQHDLREGEAFAAARARLLKHGWQPVRDGIHRKGRARDPQALRIAQSFPEVDTCSMGQVFCILYYKKAQTCLRVDTVGEEAEDMKVTTWVEQCPGAASGYEKAAPR